MAHPSLSSRLARLGVVAVTVFCLGFGAGVPQAKAVFGVADSVTVMANIPQAIQQYQDTVWSNLTNAAVGALFNALQLFLGQVAYDAANYIASGGKGQDALFYKKGFFGYFKDVGGAAVGDFVGSLSDSSFFQGLGVNLCKPSSPALMLRLQVSLSQIGQEAFSGLENRVPNFGVEERFQRPRPRCQLQEIAQNYENLYETMSNADVLKTVESSFDSTSNELGTVTNIYNRFLDNVQQRLTTASQDRQEGRGFNSVQSLISGNIRTPAAVINEATNDYLIKQPKADQSMVVSAILNNAWDIGAPQLLWYTASIFVNTLLSKLMKNVFEKGLFTAYGLRTTTTGPANIDSVQIYGREDARNANIDLKNISFFKQVTFEALAELQTCPADDSRSMWNCTIDQGLFAAMSAKGDIGSVSIAQAIEKGFLHGNWQLIPDTETRINTSKTCYSTSYCAGNIRKMRALRILPTGFEFAANSPTNIERCRDQNCVTLKEVVAGFSDCNAQGVLDEEHPWCHLIDPNWVITSLPQQCNLSGYGDSLLSPKIATRREECADVQTCLRRNDKGECVGGYGYCLAERTAYRFQADECPARYASCRTFQNRSNRNVSYLRYTVDRAFCSADNVGCLWYASRRIPTPDRDDDWLATTTTGPRVYFNKNVETCPASEEGCTGLYGVTKGVSALNLVNNGSFERKSGTQTALDDWLFYDRSRVLTDDYRRRVISDQSFTGVVGFRGGAYGEYAYQSLNVVGGRTYTLSALAKIENRTSGVSLTLDFTPRRIQPDGTSIPVPQTELNNYFLTRGSCETTANAGRGGAGYRLSTPGGVSIGALLSQDWRRFECSFVVPVGVTIGEVAIGGTDVIVDAVQLEEGEYATDFVDGVNRQLSLNYLKVAPEEFACTGAPTDHSACTKFAQVCKQQEADCQGYTDLASSAPDSEIPAILSANDRCPAQCVGYAEYRKSASAFDLVRDTDVRFNDPGETSSTAFIPSTANQCTQADVGCEAFTVAEGSSMGQTVNYNYLRTCEKPDENSETYFTWEGADTTGYQLRTWSLKKDSRTSGPKILAKLEPDQLSFKEPETCTDALWRSGFDPDCRQFYDSTGRVYYRYFSQTIISTNSCTSLRLNVSSAADCQKTGGQFTGGNECIYQASLPESRVCRAAAVSCRRYLGIGSGNVQTVLTQNFRENRGRFGGATSTEALLVGDYSLRVPVVGTTVVASEIIATTDASLYNVTFWAKSPATTTVLALKTQDPLDLADHLRFENVPAVGTVRVGPEWQRYTVGPFPGASGATSTALGWVFGGLQTNPLFLDEIVVSRIQDVVYVNEDSWRTPAICDKTPDGADLPQAMMGCRAYRDRAGFTTNAHSFTRLCREQAIGCRAFVDTRNSDPSQEISVTVHDNIPVPGYPDTATTTRPADRYVYLVDTPDKRCRAENASCRAFGRPNFVPDRNTFDDTRPFDTVYLKDDISKYNTLLCKPSELFCEEFTYGSGQKDYFRDPQNHQCTYREGVDIGVGNALNVPPGTYKGWFQLKSDVPCYPNILVDGNTFGLASGGDDTSLYRGWVGTCPAEQAECTEFRDTNDHSDPVHPSGRPYFMIRNDKVDATSCAGTVSQAQGCILFRDMGDTQTRYSTQATYLKYKQNNFNPVTPVDCRRDAENALCSEDENDANLVLKVKIDRDCAQWLGCKSAETVYDASSGRYRDICTNLALCDAASDKPEDLFCSHYVDRSSSSTEPILSEGAYFDAKLYSRRAVGLGRVDYSGYALPDAFQVSDLSMEKVGAEGALNAEDGAYKFANEYRLAATIRMPPVVRVNVGGAVGYQHIVPPGPNEARILDGTPLAVRYPTLHLCQQNSTGRIGYYLVGDRDSGRDFECFLAISGALQGATSTDALSFTNLQESFSTADPSAEALLSRAFPPSECRAHPEEDSPFPASFVAKWDLSKNPPRPTDVLQGYARANFCEFGEDCACTYKRANYGDIGGASKFYNIYSASVAPGICLGGPRAGQSCIPSTIFKSPVAGSGSPAERAGGAGPADTAQVRAIEGSNAAQTCGPSEAGGKCVPFANVSIVRGNFGACLEHDTTRIIAGDRSKQPCLTWNPNPILFGVNDPFHFVPTSGYLPPQNSGQYYCLSQVRQPRDMTFASNAFAALPGAMTKLDYDDEYTSDDSGAATSGNEAGASLNGVLPIGSDIGAQCEDTDDDQDDDNNATDMLGLRLVNTGSSKDTAYAETFFPINPHTMAIWLYGTTTTDDLTDEDISRALYERNYAYFNIEPITNRNGNGRIGCGYNQDWVDNIGSVDYDEPDEVAAADKAWHNNFRENYNPTVTRGMNEMLLSESDGHPASIPCVATEGSGFVGADNCFMKVWETKYRVPAGAGQSSEGSGVNLPYFNGLISGGRRTDRTLDILRTSPDYKRCSADKPYFGIRAVFQAKIPRNDRGAERDRTEFRRITDISGGAWSFAGFWVAACAGKSSQLHYIYMRVDAASGDICREIAEVVSRNSHQDAAFTDRTSKESTFSIPGLGIQYNDRYAPFSSALNVKPAGRDPLFQTGQEITGYSTLNPPSFIAGGLRTYADSEQFPKNKWAYLSNIFARVYRVYRFEEAPVRRMDVACLQGPFKGRLVDSLLTPSDSMVNCRTLVAGSNSGTSTLCSLNGACNTALYDTSVATEVGGGATATNQCNSLSGLNAGLSCIGGSSGMCHLGPVQVLPDTGPVVRTLPCLTMPGWTRNPTTGRWSGRGWNRALISWISSCRSDCEARYNASGPFPRDYTDLGMREAAEVGAFGCPRTPNSLIANASRTAPDENKDWPVALTPLPSQDYRWRYDYRSSSGGRLSAISSLCSMPTDLDPAAITGSAECPERIVDGVQNAPGPSGPRMAARCVDDRGNPVTGGAAGSCQVSVPRYSIAATNGGTFTLDSFDIGRDDPLRPACRADSDCSFTAMNYYRERGRGEPTLPAGDTGLSTPYVRTTSTVSELQHGPGAAEVTPASPGVNATYAVGACIRPSEGLRSLSVGTLGRCVGGLRDGMVCDTRSADRSALSCIIVDPRTETTNVCGRVEQTVTVGGRAARVPVPDCRVNRSDAVPTVDDVDLDADNNVCTHNEGYVPRLDLCPNPSDEFCGLIAYNNKKPNESLNPLSLSLLPTDVTQGLHTPPFLGLAPSRELPPDSAYGYISVYAPRPPQIASPNIGQCSAPGQCQVNSLNSFALNGQSEGQISVVDSQYKASLRFYAWAAHEQMPLRAVYVDWGDGSLQQLPDARMKNHKPYCNVKRECSSAPGLTCNKDLDCPPGAGTCQPVGTCTLNPNRICHNDGECGNLGGKCQYRNFFGNTSEACEEGYFDFSHLYTCLGPGKLPSCAAVPGAANTAPASIPPRTCYFGSWDGLVLDGQGPRPSCTDQTACITYLRGRSILPTGLTDPDAARQATLAGVTCAGTTPTTGAVTTRCSRDNSRVCTTNSDCAAGDTCIEGLAPPKGCWDARANSCRFTPRVMVMDNWGWCTGECRDQSVAGTLVDSAPTGLTIDIPRAKHLYGGCYSGAVQNSSKKVTSNITGLGGTFAEKFVNECNLQPENLSNRPWIIYPGAVNLRGISQSSARGFLDLSRLGAIDLTLPIIR